MPFPKMFRSRFDWSDLSMHGKRVSKKDDKQRPWKPRQRMITAAWECINTNHEASFSSHWRNVTYRAGQNQFLGITKKTKCMCWTNAKHLIYAESAKGITRRNIKIVTRFARTGTKEERRGKKCSSTVSRPIKDQCYYLSSAGSPHVR